MQNQPVEYDTIVCIKRAVKSWRLASFVHHTEQNKKLKCETKNKMMSMIGPVHSRCHEGSPVGKRNDDRHFC